MGWEEGSTLRIMLLRFKLSMSALEKEPAVVVFKDLVACALGSESFTKHMLAMVNSEPERDQIPTKTTQTSTPKQIPAHFPSAHPARPAVSGTCSCDLSGDQNQ